MGSCELGHSQCHEAVQMTPDRRLAGTSIIPSVLFGHVTKTEFGTPILHMFFGFQNIQAIQGCDVPVSFYVHLIPSTATKEIWFSRLLTR